MAPSASAMTSSPTLSVPDAVADGDDHAGALAAGAAGLAGIHAERVQDVTKIEAARANLDFDLAGAGRAAIERLQHQVVEDAAHGDVQRPRLPSSSRDGAAAGWRRTHRRASRLPPRKASSRSSDRVCR